MFEARAAIIIIKKTNKWGAHREKEGPPGHSP